MPAVYCKRYVYQFVFIMLFAWPAAVFAQQSSVVPDPRFIKHIIFPKFISEGVAVADINHDGLTDIIAGAYWFEAPGWNKHEIAAPQQYDPSTQFSNTFLNFTLDVDQDGWTDVIRISLPGEEAVWYKNPGKSTDHWAMHWLLTNAGNESPAFVDVDGNGRADLVCNDPVAKEMIWLQSPVAKGDTTWQRHVIAKGSMPTTGRYAHGLGWGDMNDDGRKDIIVTTGWWECPNNPAEVAWVFHPVDFGDDCSQLYAIDLNNDNRPDLVSASAHNYGIWWHTAIRTSNEPAVWQHHTIFDKFSQSHALALADVNADGHPDLITGKRYFAHNGKDPGALEPAVLYWFEYKPGKTPQWIPHLVDNNSGVGLQVVVQDINKDGRADIIVANKKGVFFFEQQPQ